MPQAIQLFCSASLLLFCILIIGFTWFTLIQNVLNHPPFVPSKTKKIRRVFEQLDLNENTRLIDLGSGDGKVVFLAADRGATAHGVDVNPFLIWWSKIYALIPRKGKATFDQQTFRKTDVSPYNTVFMYLYPEVVNELAPKLFAELQPGSMIVCNVFNIQDRKVEQVLEGDVFVYRV